MYDPSNATAIVLNSVQRSGQDVWFGQKIDIKRYFNQGAFPFWLKTGIINHDEWRINDNPRHVWNYNGPANPTEFAKFLIPSATSKWGLGTMPWINPFAVTKFYLANPQLFTENLVTAVSNWASRNYEHERITGAYLMGSATIAKKLTLTTGFRNEWTFDEGAGKKDDVAAKNRALAAGASAYQAALAEFSGRFRNSNHYSTPMGNLQAKYQITPSWDVRASWHMGIGRPDLPEVLPQLTTNDQANPPSLTVNNIALQPQFAYNYDVAVEYYDRSGFSFVADVFQKNIRNYIASRTWTVANGQDNGFEGQYAGYVATTRYNTGTALFKGLELNVSLPFSGKLPIVQAMPWLGHFGWFANYTALRTEQANPLQNFNGGSPNTQGGPPDTKRFQGFIPQTFNTGLSYNFRSGGSLYVKYNERARFLAYTSGPLNVMQKRWHTVDISARYPIGYRNYTVFCDVQNAFADRTAFYVQNGLTIRADVAPPIINLGLRGSF
jgi:outer membrane receptor protein involved in Fe transport